jgi:hypothetical protein
LPNAYCIKGPRGRCLGNVNCEPCTEFATARCTTGVDKAGFKTCRGAHVVVPIGGICGIGICEIDGGVIGEIAGAHIG